MRSKKLSDERMLLSKPGDSILETLDEYKMTQTELAERMGKTPSKINDIIAGKEPITPNTALQLETVLGISADFWLKREAIYREKLQRIEQTEQAEQYEHWLAWQPVKELTKYGLLQPLAKGSELINACLAFYGVASPLQWEKIYVAEMGVTNYRKSESVQTKLGSMAAWLRVGEIQMRKLQLVEFNKREFRNSMNDIRKLVRRHPEDFAERLQEICFDAGVGLLFSFCITGAPVSGAARWVGGNPLIQVTDRHKTNHHFWFNFFHEAAHIILHGKKEVFLEDFEAWQPDIDKEEEANDFAREWLLPNRFLEEMPEEITVESIRKVARKFETHPAVVLGRLQHLDMVPYNFGKELEIRVNLEETIIEQNKKLSI